MITLLKADARKVPLADESVQAIVTSPPYWGLRRYEGDQGAEPYGLEPTLELYIQHTVEILRECRRVLRKDGVLFWNIGDSYANDGKWGGETGGKQAYLDDDNRKRVGREKRKTGLKPKDLCLIPQRVAIAAQADGWWVRSMIVWAKPNPMPESCTDRPTDAYEHIIMLTKSERYYWDADAVREPAATGWNGSSFTNERDAAVYANLGRGPRNAFGYTSKGTHSRGTGDGGPKARARAADGVHEGWAESTAEVLGYRNMRNVWMFATQPYSEAHFATFPEELPRRCILAATSAKGACEQCGAPWERVTRRRVQFESGSGKSGNLPDGKHGTEWEQATSGNYDIRMGPVVDSQTIGWTPTCRCKGQRSKTAPCTVLDPFGGSGTTGRVAIELSRDAILLDLAYGDGPYQELAERRISKVQKVIDFGA
jgi:DNA modification methylase